MGSGEHCIAGGYATTPIRVSHHAGSVNTFVRRPIHRDLTELASFNLKTSRQLGWTARNEEAGRLWQGCDRPRNLLKNRIDEDYTIVLALRASLCFSLCTPFRQRERGGPQSLTCKLGRCAQTGRRLTEADVDRLNAEVVSSHSWKYEARSARKEGARERP